MHLAFRRGFDIISAKEQPIGFLNSLWYQQYLIQKSKNDEEKKKAELQRKQKEKENSIYVPTEKDIRPYNGKLGSHSPSSLIEQRREKEKNRQKQKESNFDVNSLANVTDADFEDAIEDTMEGG